MTIIADLRREYQRRLCAEATYLKGDIPSMADVDNRLSSAISRRLVELMGHPLGSSTISGQTAGERLEEITREFLQNSFAYLQHLRPGNWLFSVHNSITDFDQYRHLVELEELVKKNKSLKTALGDYVISPDIVVGREPVSDSAINQLHPLVDQHRLASFTPLRNANTSTLTLHASISCKWTLRSDRSQNARTEGLNLIRTRKGHTPHIAVVTGEPLPNRIASLALGTGDIDCVYHVALHELIQAIQESGSEPVMEMLETLVDGRRLRDISDLPFDLAI